MKIFEGASQIEENLKNPVVAIGNFDGVHLGHQAIFRKVIERANKIGGLSVVYTFDPHPLKVLQPDRFFPLITTREEKERVIEWTGIDVLISEKFTKEFAQLSTDEFVKEIICNKVQASLGKSCGLKIGILNNVEVDGVEVRSTMIRNYVLEGKVREAAKFLGRGYTMGGKVIEGTAQGKKMGIPTANLKPVKDLYPRSGVFAVKVILEDDYVQGVLNIGTNPTFPGKDFSLEVHILDFDQDIYGSDIELILVEKIRDEKKFETPELLVQQIKEDIKKARNILNA